MPAVLNWLLRLIPTNPICMRLVTVGSKRARHLYLRSGYLAVMIIALLMILLTMGQVNSLRDLASSGANAFQWAAYLQLTLICLLTPVFMAGAIAQEANPRTWEIMLTTPLNSLQIVLGNLFGRLFFVLALLVSSLPLFAVTQYFGGVPGRAIWLSYLIAGVASLVVAAIAVALSVSRQAGRRAVFLFYITVVIYLAITWSLDRAFRPMSPGLTTWITPLNPFLVQEVLFNSEGYRPWTLADLEGATWVSRRWLGSPVETFTWLGILISVVLIAWSTVMLRVIGHRAGAKPWYQRLGRGGEGAAEKRRSARDVWKNPIAWREAAARRQTLGQVVARWGFVGIGVVLGIGTVVLYHVGQLDHDAAQRALATIVAAEVAIITLTALNISATAISREREEGTLDLLLTTPMTPDEYISGKLRGIISFLVPMMGVPIVTLALASLYVLLQGLGRLDGVMRTASVSTSQIELPVILPEGVFILLFVLVPFIAFCVMIGLNWSLKSKGTIGSIVMAVGIVVVVVAVVSLCAFQAGQNVPILGAVFASASPTTAVWSTIYPESVIPETLEDGLRGVRNGRFGLLIGALIAGAIYSMIVYGMYRAMLGPNGKNFDMTVRRLAGLK